MGINIDFWHAWSGDTIEDLVDTFNAENRWGITVMPTYLDGYDEVNTAVNEALANDEPPDVVIGYLHQALSWEADGGQLDIQQYVNDPVWGMPVDEQEDFYPVFWDHDLIGGRRIGIAAQRSAQLLFYNASWARTLGFDAAPRTPDQFAAQACAAAQANAEDADPDNDGTGGWIITSDYPATLSWLYAFGAEVVDAQVDGYQFDTAQVADAFRFLRKLYDDGCAWLTETPYPQIEFADRQALFIAASLEDLPFQVDAFTNQGNRDVWTVIPYPSPDLAPAFSVYGPSFRVLSPAPKERLASWLFIQWLLEPQNQAEMVAATGTFPIRNGALAYLATYQETHPQWAAAFKIMPSALPEPTYQSWGVVRWAVSDAATQLFRSYFTIEQVSELADFLDFTANDLH